MADFIISVKFYTNYIIVNFKHPHILKASFYIHLKAGNLLFLKELKIIKIE
jgi:hypothetical protein